MIRTLGGDGAAPDGATLATTALQRLVDLAAADGGGEVVIPPGRWLTGMIRLRDRIHLRLLAGAELIASPRPEDHLPLAMTGGTGDHWRTGEGAFHLLLVDGCRDVRISGDGRLDGHGPAWYERPSPGPCWPLPRHRDWRRIGALLQIHASHDVVVEGIALGNAGNWTLHVHESDRVRIHGVRILNPADAPNADGIDITGSRSVIVSDCHIDTCDDAVCVKTLPGGRSCEDVVVHGCVLRSHCVALKLGCVESYRDMRRIVFSSCVVRGSQRAVGLYSCEGATVEDVRVEGITADTCVPLMFTRPLHIELSGRRPESPIGRLRGIAISGLSAVTNGRCLIGAEPGGWVEDVRLRDLDLRCPALDDPAIRGATAGGSQFFSRNPWLRTVRAALAAERVRGLRVDGLRVRWPEDATVPPAWAFADGRLANGAQHVYQPDDWRCAPGIGFHAVATRTVEGMDLDPRGLTASLPGLAAVG